MFVHAHSCRTTKNLHSAYTRSTQTHNLMWTRRLIAMCEIMYQLLLPRFNHICVCARARARVRVGVHEQSNICMRVCIYICMHMFHNDLLHIGCRCKDIYMCTNFCVFRFVCVFLVCECACVLVYVCLRVCACVCMCE